LVPRPIPPPPPTLPFLSLCKGNLGRKCLHGHLYLLSFPGSLESCCRMQAGQSTVAGMGEGDCKHGEGGQAGASVH